MAASPSLSCNEAGLARNALSLVLGGLDGQNVFQARLACAASDGSLERAALRDLRGVRTDRRLLLTGPLGKSGDAGNGESDEGTCRGQTWDARERDHDEISYWRFLGGACLAAQSRAVAFATRGT
jgi:hypothetical protein